MAGIITKLCDKCGETGEFYVRKSGKPQDCCKKCFNSRGSDYQVREKDAVNLRARKRYSKNPDKYKKQSREWYQNHPDIRLQVNKEYSKKHPRSSEANSVYCSTRRAKIKKVGGNLTYQEWKDVLEFYNYTCLCCGKSDVKLTLDHVIPLDVGGTHSSDNVQPLCGHCNSKKHTKIIDYRMVRYEHK